MPVRSLKLKLVVPRDEKSLPIRQSLWETHRVINQAVATLEQVLLLCRGREYYNTDEELVTAEDVKKQAIKYFRSVQKQNNHGETVGTNNDILSTTRLLYEAMISPARPEEKKIEQTKKKSKTNKKTPSPMEASNIIASHFAGPLMDFESKGLQNKKIKKLNDSPGQANDIKTEEKKEKLANLIDNLKNRLFLLPLIAPPIASQIELKKSRLTPWDRLALRLAIAHFLSWERWNKKAKEKYDEVLHIYEKTTAGLANNASQVEQLRTYESQRHEQLRSFGLATDDEPFRFSRRTIRAWDRVQEAWKKKPDSTEADRLAVLAELQSKLSGKFGDPDLFRWLAKDENKNLWSGSEIVAKVAHLNTVQKELNRRSPNAKFTAPDAVHHPRWLMYEPKNGTNLRKYHICNNGYEVTLDLALLQRTANGLEETNQRFVLCPSLQFASPRFEETEKNVRVLFQSASQDFSADLKSSEILLSRQYLENRTDEQLQSGDIGSVWLKVVLDVDSQAPKDWLDGRGKIARFGAIEHFKTSLLTSSKHENEVKPGARVLSVDLGLRSFAACSVFELVDKKPSQLCFAIDGFNNLWAKHERSFLLELPGESNLTAEIENARSTANKELRRIRQDINKLKSISRLVLKQTPVERKAAITDVQLEFSTEEEVSEFEKCFTDQINKLALCTEADADSWANCVNELFRNAEELLGKEVGRWRRATRRRAAQYGHKRLGRDYMGGKSAWAIEYLTNVRKSLQAWSLHGRRTGEIRRADRSRQGTFAAKLLNHINSLKEDRIKVGSDLIVQAARGFVRGVGGRWEQRFEPVRFIFMEHLARYRFKVDRPRRENSQLMLWAHREIRRQVEMQAEIYGITVGETGAGFTSRFYSRNHAPGCRSQVLTVKDMESPVFLQRLVDEGIASTIEAFRPGMRIVRDGGPDFVTLDRDRKPVVIHADINAAQNLQRRFWTRHGDPYRLTAIKVEIQGKEAYCCDSTNERLRGALKKAYGLEYICLMPADDGNGFVVETLKEAQWQRIVGQKATDDEESVVDDLLQLEDDFADVQREGSREVFFRDPSSNLLRSDRWYLSKEYWGRVKSQIVACLKRE